MFDALDYSVEWTGEIYALRAHYADFQKSKESYNHAHPQQKQPATYMIHPGTSQEKGGNRNEEEMYQVRELEMAMKRFVDSTTIAVFGNARLDRLVRIKK